METKIYNLKEVLARNISLNDDNVEYEIVCDFKDEKVLENIKEFKEKHNEFKNIKISINCNEDYLYEQNDINKLIDINSECKSLNCKTDIHLNDASGDTFNILLARRKIENFTENLKSLTTTNEQGQQVPLSPLEKYFVVFKFVANKVYNKTEDTQGDNWVEFLTSDKVICSGFASLLKCVCDRVFDKNELICYKQSIICLENGEKKDFEGHANNLILVNDPKYNIRGLFTSDACWSSARERNNNMSSSFEYCLNPLSMYGNLNGLEVLFHDKENPIYKYIDNILSDEETPVDIYNQNFVKDIGVIFRNDILKQGKDNLYKNILSQLTQEQIEKNEKNINEIEKKIPALIKENNLEFLSQIQMPYNVIPTLLDNCPGIEKYYDIIKNINIENLEESMPKLKEFEEFYNKNKEAFDYVEEISKETPYHNQVYGSAEHIITECCKLNSQNFEIQYEQAEKETEKIIDEEVKNIAENNKEFFNPPEISDEVKRECLRAVNSYVRYISDEVDYDTEDYLDWEMERLKQKKEEAFNCRQAEERIQREKAKDLSF